MYSSSSTGICQTFTCGLVHDLDGHLFFGFYDFSLVDQRKRAFPDHLVEKDMVFANLFDMVLHLTLLLLFPWINFHYPFWNTFERDLTQSAIQGKNILKNEVKSLRLQSETDWQIIDG